jgi:hypothetical protein
VIVAGILLLAGVAVFGLFMATFYARRESRLGMDVLRRA